MEIVKVQRPRIPPGAPAMIQPENNAARRTKTQRLDDDTVRAMGADLVGYFKASWLQNRWLLRRRLPDQGW